MNGDYHEKFKHKTEMRMTELVKATSTPVITSLHAIFFAYLQSYYLA
jgi:hypothetical protein